MSLLLKALKHASAQNAEGAKRVTELSIEPLAAAAPDARAEPRTTEWPVPIVAPAGPSLGDLWGRTFGARSIVYPIAAFGILFLIGYGVWVWFQLRPPAPLAATPPPGPSAPSAITAAPLPPALEAAPAVPLPPPPAAAAPTAAPATPSMPQLVPAPPARRMARKSVVPPPRPAVSAPAATVPGPAHSDEIGDAWTLLSTGRHAEALARYRVLGAREPDNVDVQLGLAAAAQATGSTRAAADAWRHVLTLEPGNIQAQTGLLALGGDIDPAAAEAALKQLIATHPSGNLHFALGNTFAARGRWADAQAAWFEAVRLDPDNADYAFNLAVALEHIGQPKVALRYYDTARALATRGGAGFDPATAAARSKALAEAVNTP